MPTIAYSSPFVPPEWIAACGCEARRVVPASGAAERSGMPITGVCPFARAFVGEVRTGVDIDAVIVTTTCDQMRRSAEHFGTVPVFLMNVPATWQTSAAKELYAGELRRLGRFLADRGGRIPPDSELAEAMKSFEADRSAAANASRKGVPVALIGGPRMRGEAWILDTINEMGGWVALDGTEGGVRTLPAPFDRQRLEEEPFEVLVDAYFGSIPAIFRRPDSMLYEWAAREVAASGARGVILMRYTWCDMWAIARARLAEATGVAVLEVDLAGDAGVEVRAVNRIAAFMETLA